jgi:Xaa-Pro aminopeptidase
MALQCGATWEDHKMSDALFSIAEYEARLDGLRQLMADNGMSGLFLTAGQNQTYLSGLPYAWRSVTRPSIFVLPLRGDPILIVHKGILAEARAYSWVSEIRSYTKRSQAPVPEMLQAFYDLELEREKRIGAELAFELRLDIPFLDFIELQKQLSGIEFVDAGGVLFAARMRKSETEIDLHRKACQITGQAFTQTFSQMREGMTEEKIGITMKVAMMELGGNQPSLLITSGEGNYDLNSKGPSQRKIKKGDLVWVDAACNVGGYWSDFSRAGVVGGPTPEQQRAQRLIHKITMRGVEMVRPGVKVSKIANTVNAELGKLDLPIVDNVSGEAARVGHGIGLAQTEQPHIAEYDDTILEPGMVITIEPAIATPYGAFRVEEDAVVTEDGYELLSTAPRELWTISL